MELKRTQTCLSKFEPTYRPVQEVEEQIAQTKAAIEAAEKAPLRDETTDRDPTYEALRSELAKAKAELAATEAGAGAATTLVRSYRNENEQLGRKELLHQDMVRNAKADEENYMLYLRKAEEARISDALDQQRFSNVVVAEPAAVPFTPQARWVLVLVVGGLFASLASVMLAFFVDRWDPSFRTPEEVESFPGSACGCSVPKEWRLKTMFLDFYRLREQPFGVTPDPRYLYFSPGHREALASLFYGIETGRGFLSLIAQPGMGKTTLLFQLLQRWKGYVHSAFLFQTQCDSRELIQITYWMTSVLRATAKISCECIRI